MEKYVLKKRENTKLLYLGFHIQCIHNAVLFRSFQTRWTISGHKSNISKYTFKISQKYHINLFTSEAPETSFMVNGWSIRNIAFMPWGFRLKARAKEKFKQIYEQSHTIHTHNHQSSVFEIFLFFLYLHVGNDLKYSHNFSDLDNGWQILWTDDLKSRQFLNIITQAVSKTDDRSIEIVALAIIELYKHFAHSMFKRKWTVLCHSRSTVTCSTHSVILELLISSEKRYFYMEIINCRATVTKI